MTRLPGARLAAASLLAATALSCSDASAPSDANRASPAQSALKRDPTLTPQSSGTTAQLIGVHAVNQNVAWVSGVGGTFAVTTDGGATWDSGVVPGAEALQFRDVQGVSATEAYLLSIGNGTDSRIYHTTDGGASWDLQFHAFGSTSSAVLHVAHTGLLALVRTSVVTRAVLGRGNGGPPRVSIGSMRGNS